jgi:5'-nucleotidase
LKFLVTNDDGVFARGVQSLAEVLGHFGEVFVVCPDQERSAISHSITLRQPIREERIDWFGTNIKAWSINGTTADCVKFGLEVILQEPPDYVFSGINSGPNLGRDIYYSGTVSGAAEAAFYHIPSVAVSWEKFGASLDQHDAKELLYSVCEVILQKKFPKGMLLNVNLPDIPKEMCKGIAVTSLNIGISRYKSTAIKDPQGLMYYWLKDHLKEVMSEAGGDYGYLRDGYITITPIDIHYEQKQLVSKVERWFTSQNKLIPIQEETTNA